jgi:transcriptional regulator with XRE-family HTH domain
VSTGGRHLSPNPTIGAKLKELRGIAQLTHLQITDRIGMPQSKVSKIETGRQLPTVDDVEALCRLYGADAVTTAALIDQANAAHTDLRAWRASHRPNFRRMQAEIAALEAQTTTVRLFGPSVIPGLLQTPEYCRAVLEVNHFALDNLSDAVAARMERQQVLYDEAKSCRFVVTEGALRWRLSPATVHALAIDRVVSLAQLPNVSVGIVPWTARVNAPQTNHFVIYDDRLVLIETMRSQVTHREAQDIAWYLEAFETLSACAVYGDEAQALLDGIATELRAIG